jgi:hypothetical protein
MEPAPSTVGSDSQNGAHAGDSNSMDDQQGPRSSRHSEDEDDSTESDEEYVTGMPLLRCILGYALKSYLSHSDNRQAKRARSTH